MIYLLNYTTGFDCLRGAPSLSSKVILHFRSMPYNLDINTMKQVFSNRLVGSYPVKQPLLSGDAVLHCCLRNDPPSDTVPSQFR